MQSVYIFVFLVSLVTLSQQRALRQQQQPNTNKNDIPKTVTGKKCQLPVEHAGKLYNSCVPDIDGHLWCPISDNGPWEKCAEQKGVHKNTPHKNNEQQVLQNNEQQVLQNDRAVFHQETPHKNNNQQNNGDQQQQQQQQQYQQQQDQKMHDNSSFWMVDDTGRLTVDGLPCVFPILYMGEVLYDCVSDVSGYEWCPTLTGSWQRCADSKDWLHEIADKYVNQVDELVVPNIGGWIPPIDHNDGQHKNQEQENQQANPIKQQNNSDLNKNVDQRQAITQQQLIIDANPDVTEKNVVTVAPPMSQTRPKSSLNRKTLVNGQQQENQENNNRNKTNVIFILFSIIPVITILALLSIFVESKYQVVEQTKQQLRKSRYIRKKWEKKHTVQMPVDIEQNVHRNESQNHILQNYRALRSDTQITAVKLSSSEGSTVTRRHTSHSGQNQNQNQNEQNNQFIQQNNQLQRPDYHVRRSRSQVHFNDDNNVHSVPSWVQNTDESFWMDISGGQKNGGIVKKQDLPQPWIHALEKVEQIQESRRAQSD